MNDGTVNIEQTVCACQLINTTGTKFVDAFKETAREVKGIIQVSCL